MAFKTFDYIHGLCKSGIHTGHSGVGLSVFHDVLPLVLGDSMAGCDSVVEG